MKSNIDLYLAEVRKKLICSPKRKKLILQYLSADIETRFDRHEAEPSMEELEREFGIAAEVAESFLKQTGMSEIRKCMDRKKALFVCSALSGALLVLVLSWYLIHRAKLQEDTVNGYTVEIIYDLGTVEGTPPPLEENDRVY